MIGGRNQNADVKKPAETARGASFSKPTSAQGGQMWGTLACYFSM
jgi:hypothetical protein